MDNGYKDIPRDNDLVKLVRIFILIELVRNIHCVMF